MRMWMVDPKFLCRKHLLGEHGEIHKHRHCFEKKFNMSGRINQIFPREMQSRHDELAEEMLKRGYNHKSPFIQPDVEYLPEEVLNAVPNIEFNISDLITRCPDCKERFLNES